MKENDRCGAGPEDEPRWNSADPDLDEDMKEAHDIAARQKKGTPIVSIHGRDVDPDEVDKKAA